MADGNNLNNDALRFMHIHDHAYTGSVSFERAGIDSQIFCIPEENLQDSPDVTQARAEYHARPGNYVVALVFGRALMAQFRYLEAIDVFSEAIVIAADKYDAYKLRGECYTAVMQLYRALADFAICCQFWTILDDILYRIGIIYYLLGDYQRAAGYFENIIRRGEAEGIELIAAIDWAWMSYMRCGDSAGAEKVLGYLPALEGELAAYRLRCAVYARIKTIGEALSTASALEKEVPKITSLYGLSVYCEVHGNKEKARQLWEEILAFGSHWSAFGYLAAMNDLNRSEEGR